MVHVKKVEIFGFKSFGFKNTAVHFEPGLVSISGPNGSGKSNILDAIIFAMGENKPKKMRVEKLRALIHDIEGNRRTPKMARSSVHFDNSDRKIPVDSDSVEVTREMDANGENTYYLNKKKTTRNHVLDLLDMANAGLGQLNAVQQGTVTRISEMSSDEKRTTIEAMIGLSYYDEKKREALDNLDKANRNLEIALVKMEEVKKQVDELEEERNQKLRNDFLQREIDRYRAMDAANRLKKLMGTRTSKQKSLDEFFTSTGQLKAQRDALNSEIASLESARSDLMTKAKAQKQAEAELSQQLSGAKQAYDAEESAKLVSEKRVAQIESRLPEIKSELGKIANSRADISGKIAQAESDLESITRQKAALEADLAQVDSQRSQILDQQSKAAAKKSEIDSKLKTLNSDLNDAKLDLAKNQHKKEFTESKIKSNSSTLDDLKENTEKLVAGIQKLRHSAKNHKDTISELNTRLARLCSKKSKIRGNLEDLDALLEKSSKAANQYESKIKTVKGFMHEDYTAAKLKEDQEKLGILGLVYKLITWDKRYDRPVLAVSSDWLKAIVVRDFATLLGVAESARSKKLPRLKIIPLEAIPKFKLNIPKEPGVLGVLSDYVQCDYQYMALKTFLFGNIILADSKESAYRISKQGYKSVTLDGEFFEARGGTVVIDINSKISKLTKLISMSTDIEGLFKSIRHIKAYAQKQKHVLKKLEASIQSHTDRRSISEKTLASVTETVSNLESRLDSARKKQALFVTRIAEHSESLSGIAAEITKSHSHMESLEERIMLVEENYAAGEQNRIAHSLSKINAQKSDLEVRSTKIARQHGNASSDLTDLRTRDRGESTRAGNLKAEESSLLHEKAELEGSIRKHEEMMQLKDRELVSLRSKEQAVFSSSASSLDEVGAHDAKLKELHKNERQLVSEINSIARSSDSLQRDLSELEAKETGLRQVLSGHDFGKDADLFDVSAMLQALNAEIQSMGPLNAKAPDSYIAVSEGHRLWTPRKNSLEEERNKIVKFIEDIDKDKRQAFLDAFDKVNKEIRLIFSKMTGGNAWLELQNEDDIFGSGISYLIQFPNKPKRESTSISGGEKTLAAIVFVLALQKLEPSPFYLFDEVDAHLDAPNAERLAKILGERAKESQFIMVSLKDSVVQKAKLIYGVYPKNGVSNVVTYKDKRLQRAAG